MKIISRLFISFIAVSAISANAALYNRGNGMIYDSSLNITWLQDADYARTSGYFTWGFMNWQESTDWAANLVYSGFSDWRLPSARLAGNPGGFGCNNDGSTDCGYNNTRSEIGHLFLELGNKAYYNTASEEQEGYGVTNVTFVDADTNQSVSFMNMGNSGYWEAETISDGYPISAWNLNTFDGFHGSLFIGYRMGAWAVRDGDVLPVNEVPVPAAAWLMGSGLIGLAGIARRKK